MEPGLTLSFSLMVVALLLLGNAVFIAAEFAILRSSMAVVNSEEYRARLGGRSAVRVLGDLDRCLLATKLATVVSSIVLGWFGLQMMIDVLEPWLLLVSTKELAELVHGVSLVVAVVLLLSLHMLLGELFAKALACRYPEATLRILAWPTLLLTTLFAPLIFVLGGLSTLLLRSVGVTHPPKLERAPTSDELARLVSRSGELGVLDKDEEYLLRSVFQFGETVAREVMTPRTDLVTVHVSDSYADILATVEESGLSRLPVRGNGVDDILGVLLARDLLIYCGNGKDVSEFHVENTMREPYFIPGTKPIDELLKEFKLRKVHLAIVLDEHGGVDGVVTLEDLLEELVGDIFDESDEPAADVVVADDGLLVDGGVLVSDLNSEHNLGIPEGDYDTIAGFIFTHLGRLPEIGDQIVLGAAAEELAGDDSQDAAEAAEARPHGAPEVLIRVDAVSGHRVERLKVEFPAGNGGREPVGTADASNKKGELSAANDG